MGRFDAFMTKPERNRGDIHPCLEEMHSRRVANDMRRDVLGRETGTNGARSLDGLL